MSIYVDLLRIITAFGLAFVWCGLIPIYGTPFGGCTVQGYLTLELGCSSWPEFLVGFGAVLIIAVISPYRARMHFVAVGLFAFVAILGGFSNIGLAYLPSFSRPIDWLYLAYHGSPVFFGSLTALLLVLGLVHFLTRGADKSAA